MKTGLLLINLGTPDAATPDAVGRYLREFLMDPFVIDTPKPLRWFLVNIVIVPRRKHKSAAAYQKIQMPEGSPLLVHTRALARGVLAELGDYEYAVEFGMRYGNPSIASALERLKQQDVSRIIVLPLYPQYAESSFETAVVETKKSGKQLECADRLTFLEPFYNRPEFINAWAERIRQSVGEQKPEHFLFSFHSLPVRHVLRVNGSNQHCLKTADCCDRIMAANQNCYRAQSFATARAIADQVGLVSANFTVAFQSRLGRAEWIGPDTEAVICDLARRGLKRVAVACPSFVADCLETLEEIAIRGRELFVTAGGEDLQLIPSLNSDRLWVQAVAEWVTTVNPDSTRWSRI